MQERKDVFIIGNGFDLNLGLPTSYNNFLNSDIFKEFSNSSALFCSICKKANLEKWVDIESELASISREEVSYPNFLIDYKLLCDCLSNYIKSLDVNKINRDSHAYRFLKSNYTTSGSYIANFNYTNTVQFILNEIGFDDKDINASVNHVHGECRDGNIIFGVNDKEKINTDHVFLYKSTSNNDGGRGVKNALKNAKRIFFFGHSLGESDHMYLREFFKHAHLIEKNLELHFYYYGEIGFYDLHKQLHNLTSNSVSELKSKNIFYHYDTSLDYIYSGVFK